MNYGKLFIIICITETKYFAKQEILGWIREISFGYKQVSTNAMTTLRNILTILTMATTTVFAITSCVQKELDWTQLTSFKIYDYKTFPQDKDIRTFSESDIQQMNFIETNLDEAKNLFIKAKPLGGTTYLWKGHHFTTATFSDGQTSRVKVSSYGGFFMDLTTNKYYEFQGDTRTEWDNFWRKYYGSLHK